MGDGFASLGVFCGSRSGAGRTYIDAAASLGELLADRGITLVYGGASVGLMGVLAEAALARGGRVVGVLPRHLVGREIAHNGLSELCVVADLYERKATMARMSEGFIALPGGPGTLDELFDVWTWGQLGMHAKPCGILNVKEYYDHLTDLVDHMVGEEFLAPAYRDMLAVDNDPVQLLDRMAVYSPPRPKWPPPEAEQDAH